MILLTIVGLILWCSICEWSLHRFVMHKPPFGFTYAYDAAINYGTNSNYYGGFIMVQTATSYKAKYTNLISGATFTQSLNNDQLVDVLRVYPSYVSAGNKLEILNSANAVLWAATFKPNLNCRYTPVVCDFVNKYGCWQRAWFYAASNDTLSVENTNYNLMQSTFANYNTLEGQTKSFNTNGKKSLKVNTDWVDESYNDLLKQLMLSERIVLNNYPASLKRVQNLLIEGSLFVPECLE